MEVFVKEYLNEQGIKTVEGLTQHIIELKRNTVVPDIVFDLVDVLVNDKDCLLSFFAENKIDNQPKSEYIFFPQLSKEEYDEKFFKIFSVLIDEVVEEELPDMLSDKEPYKETEGKLYYELSWEFIEEMAKRMQYHKNGKYELYNWKNKPMTPKGIDDMKQAINRHHIEVMKGNYDDGEEFLGHIVSYATNSMILWGQLKLNKS